MAMTDADVAAIGAEIPNLRRYARTLTGRADTADDLVQDALERAIARFEQFRRGTNLRAWLFTILHNAFCDQFRRNARRARDVPMDEAPERLAIRPEQADALHLRDLKRAVRRLSAPHREVLALVAVEEMSYEQAAEILGVEVGTVKSRVSRARDCLRSEMSKLSGVEPETVVAERRARRGQSREGRAHRVAYASAASPA